VNKAFTIDTAVTEIAKGALGTDLVAYNCKVAASTFFTAWLDTPDRAKDYTGTSANLAAKAWLSTVVDEASLAKAIAPGALGDPGQFFHGPIQGINMGLIAGVDALPGGAITDVFHAIPATLPGHAPITLDAADPIHAGDAAGYVVTMVGVADFDGVINAFGHAFA
jgi:hypothetical protein